MDWLIANAEKHPVLAGIVMWIIGHMSAFGVWHHKHGKDIRKIQDILGSQVMSGAEQVATSRDLDRILSQMKDHNAADMKAHGELLNALKGVEDSVVRVHERLDRHLENGK